MNDHHSPAEAAEQLANRRSTPVRRRLEEKYLAQERQDPSSPYYRGEASDTTPSSRRRFMLGAAAAIGAAGSAKVAYAATPGAIEREVPEDPSKTPGVGVGADDDGYGMRSQFETEVRERFDTVTAESSWSFTPLQKSVGMITPSGLHYE